MKRKVYWIDDSHDKAVKKTAKKAKRTESSVARELIETLSTYEQSKIKENKS